MAPEVIFRKFSGSRAKGLSGPPGRPRLSAARGPLPASGRRQQAATGPRAWGRSLLMSTRSRSLAASFAALLALIFLGVAPAQAGPGKPAPAGTNSAAADAGVRAAAVPAASAAALSAIQTRVADYVARNGTRYSFADYVDPATGQIVLETDAPAGVVGSLTNLSGVATAATA